MSTVKGPTIDGYNKFLSKQKETKVPTKLTLAQFDDIYEELLNDADIRMVSGLTRDIYEPRNSTALLDSMGKLLNRVEGNRRPGERNIVVIITDGEENASHEYSRSQVFELVSKLRSEGVEFIFMGANQDAIKEGNKYGIPSFGSITYTMNNTQQAWNTLSNQAVRAATDANYTIRFTGADRVKLTK
jgi:hypothetical protein